MSSDPPPDDPARREVVRTVLDLLWSRPPTLGVPPGAARLVCVDGPAGSGKTTLAIDLATATGATVVHTDEMLEGWRGLPGLADAVERFLAPLARGEAGTWTRWDWVRDGWAEQHRVEPTDHLVLDGTGCWSPAIADLVTVLVWVEAPPSVRLARGLARDGEAFRPQWEQWRLDENALHSAIGTREHADVLVHTG